MLFSRLRKVYKNQMKKDIPMEVGALYKFVHDNELVGMFFVPDPTIETPINRFVEFDYDEMFLFLGPYEEMINSIHWWCLFLNRNQKYYCLYTPSFVKVC